MMGLKAPKDMFEPFKLNENNQLNQTTMIEKKRYGKSELAMIYFPETDDPDVARNHLRDWINRNPELLAALRKFRRGKFMKDFIWEEVEQIMYYLGEPNEKPMITHERVR